MLQGTIYIITIEIVLVEAATTCITMFCLEIISSK